MSRRSWRYQSGVPVIEVRFALADGSGFVSMVLQVDTGAVGMASFSLSQRGADFIGWHSVEPVVIESVTGETVMRGRV